MFLCRSYSDDTEGCSYGQLVIGSCIMATHLLMHHVSCRVLMGKHQITPLTKLHYIQDWAPCDFRLFPKLKSSLKGKRFQTINKIQANTTGQLMAIGRTVWGPKLSTSKGIIEASLSYVQCFFYLVSCSINVFIFIVHGWIPSGHTSYILFESHYSSPLCEGQALAFTCIRNQNQPWQGSSVH